MFNILPCFENMSKLFFFIKFLHFHLFKEYNFLEAYSKHTFFESLSLSRYLYSVYIHMFVEKFVYANVLMLTSCSLRVSKSARFCPPTHVTAVTSQPTHSRHHGDITARSLTSPRWHHRIASLFTSPSVSILQLIKQVLIWSGIQIPFPVSIWVPFDICLPISCIFNYVLSLIFGVKQYLKYNHTRPCMLKISPNSKP